MPRKPQVAVAAAPRVVEVDHTSSETGRDMNRLDEAQLTMLSVREDYTVLLEQRFASGAVVQLVENPHIGDARRFGVRSKQPRMGPDEWRLAGNGTLGGIWLTRPSAAGSFLNRTLPDDGLFYAVQAG